MATTFNNQFDDVVDYEYDIDENEENKQSVANNR
jgi:hypothetical protein